MTHRSYGFEVHGLSSTPRLVGVREQPWYDLVLHRERGAAPRTSALTWAPDQVQLDAAGHVSVVVTRSYDPGRVGNDLSARVCAPEPIPDDEIEHPLLAFVAGVAARWLGRTALHGAAVVLHGRSWVLLGGPGSGKSTLAAALSGRGHAVQSDDLSIVSEGVVFAGPRSCDLRSGSARRFRGGRAVTRPGERRWRSELGEAPYEAPLGGLIDLRWGVTSHLEAVPLAERLGVLARAEALGRGPSQPTSFLSLLATPVLALTRSRSWDELDATLSLIEDVSSA